MRHSLQFLDGFCVCMWFIDFMLVLAFELVTDVISLWSIQAHGEWEIEYLSKSNEWFDSIITIHLNTFFLAKLDSTTWANLWPLGHFVVTFGVSFICENICQNDWQTTLCINITYRKLRKKCVFSFRFLLQKSVSLTTYILISPSVHTLSTGILYICVCVCARVVPFSNFECVELWSTELFDVPEPHLSWDKEWTTDETIVSARSSLSN